MAVVFQFHSDQPGTRHCPYHSQLPHHGALYHRGPILHGGWSEDPGPRGDGVEEVQGVGGEATEGQDSRGSQAEGGGRGSAVLVKLYNPAKMTSELFSFICRELTIVGFCVKCWNCRNLT